MLFNLIRAVLSTSPRQCRRHEDWSVSSSSPSAGEDCLAPCYTTMMVLLRRRREKLDRRQLPHIFYHDPSAFSLRHLFSTAVMHKTHNFVRLLDTDNENCIASFCLLRRHEHSGKRKAMVWWMSACLSNLLFFRIIFCVCLLCC